MACLVLAGLAAAGVYFWRQAPHGVSDTASQYAPTVPGNSPSAPHSAGPAHYPIEQAAPASASTTPLPALDQSDAEVATALLALAGDNGLDRLLLRDQIIRRIVATVDALPRQGVGDNILPVRTPGGRFLVEQTPGGIVLSPRNAQRYASYMHVLEHVDPRALVDWYVRHYALFQQAYRDLGYPQGYFNDRLVAAIDDMLAAPVLDAPVPLEQPKVFYRYADPQLEERSAGQKMLMRLGPDDEAAVKAKLRTLRTLITGATGPAPSRS